MPDLFGHAKDQFVLTLFQERTTASRAWQCRRRHHRFTELRVGEFPHSIGIASARASASQPADYTGIVTRSSRLGVDLIYACWTVALRFLKARDVRASVALSN